MAWPLRLHPTNGPCALLCHYWVNMNRLLVHVYMLMLSISLDNAITHE